MGQPTGNDFPDFVTGTMVPLVLSVVVAVMAWVIKKLIDLSIWRGKMEQHVEQHAITEERAMDAKREAAVSLDVARQHGEEMNEIRDAILALSGKLDGGFSGLDTRLARMEQRCAAHVQEILRINGAHPEEKKPGGE